MSHKSLFLFPCRPYLYPTPSLISQPPMLGEQIAVVHQPHFLPWAGYYNKLSIAHSLVLQDNVQFRRRYFQNRTLIRNPQGHAHWLTIPVHARRSTLIKDVKVASTTWADDLRKILWHSYASADHFSVFWDTIAESLRNDDKYLLDINERTLSVTTELLGLDIPLSRTSSLRTTGDWAERLIQVCQAVGATAYLYGEGSGIERHPPQRLDAYGIKTYKQDFRAGFLRAAEGFDLTVWNVSIVELLFVHGLENTFHLINTSEKKQC